MLEMLNAGLLGALIGMETTTYVRNVFKYYVSYKLTTDARNQTEQLKQQVAPARR
jgi:hypothetical protein